MPTLPPSGGPPHPLSDLGPRIGRLSLDGRTVGALRLAPVCYWETEGRGRKKRFTDPDWTADIWVTIDGDFDDPFYFHPDDLEELLAALGQHTWIDRRTGVEYDLVWLDGSESEELARAEFGDDLGPEFNAWTASSPGG